MDSLQKLPLAMAGSTITIIIGTALSYGQYYRQFLQTVHSMGGFVKRLIAKKEALRCVLPIFERGRRWMLMLEESETTHASMGSLQKLPLASMGSLNSPFH
jgi:hypothetical protein